MDCPACLKPLTALPAGDIEVDACQNGCGGVWFDAHELDKFDEPCEFPTHSILSLAKKKESVHVAAKQVRKCPKCPGEVLIRQWLDTRHEVEIDQCWNCGGVWLDVGEINTIRGQFSSYAERAQAVNEYIDAKLKETEQLLADKTRADVQHYSEETSNRFKAALHAFKRLIGLDVEDGML